VIALDDRVSLAPAVAVEDGLVVDSVRGLRVPASPAALLVLAHADGRSIRSVGAVLARHGAQEGDRDALDFCAELNRRLLVNVAVAPSSALRRALTAAAHGILWRAPARRVRSTVRGLAVSTAVLAALVVPPALFVHAWPLAVGVSVGVGLHEAAHALALHGVPRALVLHGIRPTFLHPPLDAARSLLVAASGPLAPSLAGLLALVVWNGAAAACAPLAAHALGLTVLAPDGRNACGLS
jgi:hypothetical protein